MALWDSAFRAQLTGMQSAYVTAAGRTAGPTSQLRSEEAAKLYSAHLWNPGIAALSAAVERAAEAGGGAEAGGAAVEESAVRSVQRTLTETNQLLSKTIRLLASNAEPAIAWSSYRALMEGLQKLAEGQSAAAAAAEGAGKKSAQKKKLQSGPRVSQSQESVRSGGHGGGGGGRTGDLPVNGGGAQAGTAWLGGHSSTDSQPTIDLQPWN